MSTAISMPSGRFGSFNHHPSSTFRSTPRIRRPYEEERLKALASDEFSDDESDGDTTDDEDDDLNENQNESMLELRKQDNSPNQRDDVDDRQSDGPEGEFELDETIIIPFVRPVAQEQQSTISNTVTSQITVSPKAEDWTIVDKSPTFASVFQSKVKLTESWFEQPGV